MTSPSRQGHVSPASSPRLPSPPPFPEVQIGPRSPSPGSGGNVTEQNAEKASLDQSASRRIRPGTRAADMASGPPLIPLSEVSFSCSATIKRFSTTYTLRKDANSSSLILRFNCRNTSKHYISMRHDLTKTIPLYRSHEKQPRYLPHRPITLTALYGSTSFVAFLCKRRIA